MRLLQSLPLVFGKFSVLFVSSEIIFVPGRIATRRRLLCAQIHRHDHYKRKCQPAQSQAPIHSMHVRAAPLYLSTDAVKMETNIAAFY